MPDWIPAFAGMTILIEGAIYKQTIIISGQVLNGKHLIYPLSHSDAFTHKCSYGV